MSKYRSLWLSISVVALLGACAVTPEPFSADKLNDQAREDRAVMFDMGEPLTGTLTISEAIARSVKYNLDKRAKMMEEALALGQTDLDRFDALPKITTNAGYNSRSKPNATISRDYVTQTTGTGNYSYSADRDAITHDLGLSWNILDFGVSYYTANQNADRALISSERKRKAQHNLVSEVRFAFWRTAAWQVLGEEMQKTAGEIRKALDTARTVEKENLKAPLEALRYQKSLLETLRQLTAIEQELSTAPIELAALINVPPGTTIKIAMPEESEMKTPIWAISPERMEEMAFSSNPDLREQGYLTRISVADTKKAILKMLPGINFTTTKNYDHNSFLDNNHWYEAGAKLSWNLMNVIAGPTSYKYAKTNESVVAAKRIALRMAVLAQIHVANRQFQNAENQFLQADELWSVDKRLADLASARTAEDAQGVLEKVAGQASAIASRLRRFQTYAQAESSYAKIQSTIGQDLIPQNAALHDLNVLSRVVGERLENWKRGEFIHEKHGILNAIELETLASGHTLAVTAVPTTEAEKEVAIIPAVSSSGDVENSIINLMIEFIKNGLEEQDKVVGEK